MNTNKDEAPRYEVISDYPNASFAVGAIIDFEEAAHYAASPMELNFEKYPNIFKHLSTPPTPSTELIEGEGMQPTSDSVPVEVGKDKKYTSEDWERYISSLPVEVKEDEGREDLKAKIQKRDVWRNLYQSEKEWSAKLYEALAKYQKRPGGTDTEITTLLNDFNQRQK